MELIKVVLNDKYTQFEHSNDMQQYNILKQRFTFYTKLFLVLDSNMHKSLNFPKRAT